MVFVIVLVLVLVIVLVLVLVLEQHASFLTFLRELDLTKNASSTKYSKTKTYTLISRRTRILYQEHHSEVRPDRTETSALSNFRALEFSVCSVSKPETGISNPDILQQPRSM